ncbi:MAG: Lrp/AsnC ligand binding domain-containing protein [Candidatus Caldarchaeum sp.]|uniref:Transcription regulator AsnC/Lrp ligand binding domain-containing protein n=1 Tax=Caldiarchaeum subterraneum TaxID=311458 RepID=A0A7C5QN00_CALS0
MKVMAYVLVQTLPGTSHEVVASRNVPGVIMANSVFGRYDAVIVMSADSLKDLSRKVYEAVGRLPYVVKVETLVCMPSVPEQPPKKREELRLVTSFHCPSCHALNEVGAAVCYFCGYSFQ